MPQEKPTLDLTTGSVGRHVVSLAVPGMLTNLMTFSTTLVDMMWVGRISPEAIAAITTHQYIWFLFSILNQMIGQGSVTLIARSYGSGDSRRSAEVLGETFFFKLVVALIVMLIGLLTMAPAYRLFGITDETVFRYGMQYSGIMFAATPLLFSTFTLKTGFRAVGAATQLFWVSLMTMLINLVLDPFLIFERIDFMMPLTGWHVQLPGLGMEVAGAAWASVLAFAITFVTTLFLFLTGRTFIRLRFRDLFSPSLDTARRILKIGLPPAAGNSLEHFANVLIGSAVNTYGTTVYAAQGVNNMLQRLIQFSIMGFSWSTITMVGQNLGAAEVARAEKSVKRSAAIIAGVLFLASLSFYFAAPSIAALFMPVRDDASRETVDWIVRILRINCFLYLPLGLNRVYRAVFEGSGDTRPVFWASALTTWGLQVPLVMTGVYIMRVAEPVFIWWVMVAGNAVAACILYALFLRGAWKHHKV
ncbi:MATE family efflux transporter [bacterium]|nr:MATE family efflux transporter [bacterium]